MTHDMKRDWDERARQDARYYIASHEEAGEAAFAASGQRDVELFFAGIEHLLAAGAAVVDIGCGIGRMDEFIAPRIGKLTGVDVSREMIARARQRLAHIDNVEFLEVDGSSIPLPDASVDLVFSHIVFQHIPRQIAKLYFPEAMRVLRPGGHFVFQMPEVCRDAPDDPPDDDTFEMRFYDEADLRSQLMGLGFVMLETLRFPVESPTLRFNQMRLHCSKAG